MTDIVGSRQFIQEEEVKAQAAVSESTMTRMGSMLNFIAAKEFTQHDFNLNGAYNIIPTPNLAVDGYVTYPFDFEIIDVLVFIGDVQGTSGTTEIDLKWRAEGGGAYASIFSTTPKFTYLAATGLFTRVGVAPAHFTAPVLSKTTFAAYDAIRLDVLTAVAGAAKGCFVKLFIRPI
jgi:hypothetical protein